MNHFWKCLVQYELLVESITHGDGKKRWPSQKNPPRLNNQGRDSTVRDFWLGCSHQLNHHPWGQCNFRREKGKEGDGRGKMLTQTSILSEHRFFSHFYESDFHRRRTSEVAINTIWMHSSLTLCFKLPSMFSFSRNVMKFPTLTSLLCCAHPWPGCLSSFQTHIQLLN